MLPSELKAEQFAGYPPEARMLVISHLDAIRQLPLSIAPSLLRELVEYDFKFPAERAAIDGELTNLSSLSRAQMQEWFGAFSSFSLSPNLQRFDWINQPAQFVEQLSAYLWTTHQLDGFRQAAISYGDRLQAVLPKPKLPVRRLGIAIIGQGLSSYEGPLFRNLRAHGTYFRNVDPKDGVELLLAAAAARAKTYPATYGHWYVDGGQEAAHSPLLTCVSYRALEPVRSALLKYVQTEISQPGMGPEELRSRLARLSPADLGMERAGDKVLGRFEVRLFTEGSGTQIFSTTFAQWAARETLRRAQPLTLLVRFAPRQEQKPMNELLTSGRSETNLDFAGSLVDADMGAYYQWINQQRLPGAGESSFLVWYEAHKQALVVAPGLPRGAESTSAKNLDELLTLATS
ncbi:hypothetical protein ACPOL_1948 [Acidisarcina polymorpha]|uniref:Uncharacterized protein n=1 Tax=Acidisarcina polymorpha TaxID=2211140 RepID=A0A2Z5FXP7_9BACT|nr:hypothetical protein [Acidisarcina polymorpha]AXC11284.1 hypothetical protein ACPOL_1948 [Acidisarcina polymorpha]